jgi:hypothetical protein
MKYKKGQKVWLVNVSLDGQSLMFHFPTKEKQMSMVNQIKDTVDNVIYALESVELVKGKSKEKSKKITK